MTPPFHVELLEEELRRRKEKNPRYSLRAFASFLHVDPSALSRILTGKQDVSVGMALEIIERLKLGGEAQERFVLSVAHEKYRQTLHILSEGAPIDQLSAALRASEERYGKLMEVVDQTVSVCELIRDENGAAIDARILRVNPAWQKNTGVEPAAAIGRAISTIIPQSYRDALAIYERVVRTRTTERIEQYVQDLDCWFDLLVVPLEDDRYMVLGVNTTERNRMQERHAYLLGLSNLLRDLADPVRIQYEAARFLAEHLKADRGHYTELDEARDSSVVHVDYVTGGAASVRGVYAISSFPSTYARGRHGPVVVADVENCDFLSDAERRAYLVAGLRASIYVALVKDRRSVAGFSITHATPRAWRALEIELVRETAELTWAAVQRARAEEALRRSEAAMAKQSRFLEATLSSLPDPVYAFDRGRKLAYVNPAMCRAVGLERDQIIGKTPAELDYPPDLVARFDREMDAVLVEGKTVQGEVEFRIPTAPAACYHYIWGPVRAEDGSVELGVGVSRDTTERLALEKRLRESEARLQLVLERLPLAIGVVDDKGELVFSNEEMREYLPTATVPSNDRGQTSRWRGVHPDGSVVRAEDFPTPKALRGEEYPHGLEMTFAREDGGEKQVRVSSRALREPGGRITGAFIVVESLAGREFA